MNTKQTPEEAAMEAMHTYAERFTSIQYGRGHSTNHGAVYDAARQTIIKAFQDRAELLAALESIIIRWDDLPNDIYGIVNNVLLKVNPEGDQ